MSGVKESDVAAIAEYCGLEADKVPGLKVLLDTLVDGSRFEALVAGAALGVREPVRPEAEKALDGQAIADLIFERGGGALYAWYPESDSVVHRSGPSVDLASASTWVRNVGAQEAFLRGPDLLPYWLRLEAATGRERAFLVAEDLVPREVKLWHEAWGKA